MLNARQNSPVRDHLDLGVLDALRGLAAIYVVLFHANQVLWAYADGAPPVGPSLPDVLARGWIALMGYGHVAVLLFFLISGFCIHYRQALQAAVSGPADARPLDLGGFALRRLRRLYPVLMLALAVTLAFDTLGATLSPSLYAGTGAPLDLSLQLAAGSLSATGLIANLLFQGGLSVPVFGSNVPLWSLAYEFWFYALYPVMLLLSRRVGSVRMLLVVAAVSVLATLGSRHSIPVVPWWLADVLAHWVTWVAGAFIAELCVRPRRKFRGGWLLIAGGLAVGGYMVAQTGAEMNVVDLGWGLALSGLLAGTMLTSPSSVFGRWIESVARRLAPAGAMSYSLYALHFPLLVVLLAWWQSTHASAPVGPQLMIAGACGAIALGASAWYGFERRSSARLKFWTGRSILVSTAQPNLNEARPTSPPTAAYGPNRCQQHAHPELPLLLDCDPDVWRVRDSLTEDITPSCRLLHVSVPPLFSARGRLALRLAWRLLGLAGPLKCLSATPSWAAWRGRLSATASDSISAVIAGSPRRTT
jgi:peptidoglycan/LPS O-acetylase OafA/YrhL